MVWYGTVWYGTVCYGVVWYSTVWCSMVWSGTVLYGVGWYCAVRYGMVWYNSTSRLYKQKQNWCFLKISQKTCCSSLRQPEGIVITAVEVRFFFCVRLIDWFSPNLLPRVFLVLRSASEQWHLSVLHMWLHQLLCPCYTQSKSFFYVGWSFYSVIDLFASSSLVAINLTCFWKLVIHPLKIGRPLHWSRTHSFLHHIRKQDSGWKHS